MGVSTTVSEVIEQARRDDVQGLAAELAFRFFLALFPFFIFLGAIGSFVAGILGIENPGKQLADSFGSNMPPAAGDLIRGVVQDTVGTKSYSILSITVLGAIWVATTGMETLIKAMNRAYDVRETRSFWRRYLTALLLTLVAAPLMLVVFLSLLAVQVFGTAMADALGAGDAFRMAIDVLRWPVVALLLSVLAGLIYRYAPNVTLPWKWLSAGALVFAVAWLVATYLFGVYVANFGSYGNVYGVLGGVAILLIWFYMISFALLVGAEVNAVIDKRTVEQLADNVRQGIEDVRRRAA